jgi:CubicO group peptidase (beta-lactamase class C family)
MRTFEMACWLLMSVVPGRVGAASIPAPTTAPTPSHQADVKPIPTSGPTAHALVPTDLEAFFDGIVPLQLERSDIAGASVLVVQDGRLLLQKGYGYSDVSHKKPVDPSTTIFRLASISKLFTWVSVMQLEEQGKIDLDADVNRYLDFRIKPAFGRPVTLRNLMTHTGGFEEVVRDIIVTNPKQASTLRDYLMRNQPERLFSPGTVPAYSNFGVGLAGYIVQRVSGQPFEQYVEQHIFTPLAMLHSTFYQPPPERMKTLPSQGYGENSEKPVIGFEIFNPVPAGGVSSTAVDMGRFGQALLNGGELDGHRILKRETLAAMWTPQFRSSDQMPPIDMGFYQTWRNGLRWIGHEGDLVAFHSLFFLEPQKKIILFISYNSSGSGAKSRPELVDMFTDRYFPGQPAQTFLNFDRKQLEAIAGVYQSTRRSDSTKLKFISLLSQRTASVDKDGALHLEDLKDLRNHTIKWKPIGKDLWQEIDGQRRVFAIRDGNGQVVRIAGDFPGVQLQRVPWWEHATPVFTLVAACGFILLAVVASPVLRFVRRVFFRSRARPEPYPGTRWLPFTAQITAVVWLTLFGVLGAGVVLLGGGDAMPPTSAWDKYLVSINIVTALATILSVAVVFSAIRVWAVAGVLRSTRIKYSTVALACAFLSWFAIHWHVLGAVRL